MSRTLLIGTEVGLAATTTLDSATVVRVYNGVGATATVSIAKSTFAGYAGKVGRINMVVL